MDEIIVNQVHKNTSDITQLKSNVKWIYQYGGVGGSGGGNGPTTDWSIYAILDNKVLKNNNQFLLDDKDDNGNSILHNLVISISNPNGLTYTITTITYFNGSKPITQSINKKLSPGNYEYRYNDINVHGNGEIKITVRCDETYTPKELSSFVVCNPFSVLTSFQDQSYKQVSDKDAIYVSSINKLYLTVDYTLYLSQNESNVQLVVESSSLPINNLPEDGKVLLSDRIGQVRFEINDEIFSDSKYYGINTINMYLNIDSGSSDPEKIDLSSTCTLIPNGLFLRISPYYKSNNLYSDTEYISLSKPFNTGLLYFNLTGYYGTANRRTFNVSCIKTKIGSISKNEISIDDDYTLPSKTDFMTSEDSLIFSTAKNSLNVNTIPELVNTKAYLNISEPGIYALSFLISVEENANIIIPDDVYVYYVCVIAAQNSAHWLEDIEFEQLSDIKPQNTLNSISGAISTQYSCHYKFGDDITDNIKNDVQKYGSYITVNSNNTGDINLIELSGDNQPLQQYIINIGIQYSNVNKEDAKIFELKSKQLSIEFYQDHVLFGNTSLDIYVPLTNSYNPSDQTKYHLISIVFQKIKNTVNSYSCVFYIDGIQENCIREWIAGATFNQLVLSPANYSINLIDIKNITDTIKVQVDQDLYKEYSLEIRDHIIAEYYMQYAINIYGSEPNEYNKQVLTSINTLNISKKFVFDDNVVEVKDGLSTLTELRKSMPDTPMLVLDFSEELQYNTKDQFFNDFFFPDASSNTKKLIFKRLFYNNFTEDDCIKLPGQNYWQIEPQGSSSLGYRIKNLELSAITFDSSENATQFIFSPNFKNVTNTMSNDEKNNIYATAFLPEVSFTLKADEMDSSHCNNTSVGLFVNKVCTPFADARNLATTAGSNYRNYVKNCLTGYPCLLFVQVKDPTGKDLELYYLGIYNFNLGRGSSFNLGYYDLKNTLDNIRAYDVNNGKFYPEIGLRDGFNIYNITVDAIKNQEQSNKNLCIAEVKNNGTRLDFSQYDESILFEQKTSDTNFTDVKFMLGSIVPKFNNTIDQNDQKNALQNFVKSITLAGGFIFDTIGKGMSTSIDDEYGYKEGYGYKTAVPGFKEISKNMVPNYRYQNIRTLQNDTNIYTYREIAQATEEDFINAICEQRDEHSNLQKIPSLDYVSILEYYVICMAFGMVDSVQKNLNVKSWTAANTTGARFYIAFYDMDTCLGRTNSGGTSNKYAFSDYWVTLHNNSSVLEQSEIFKDFFPLTSADSTSINRKPGFDTPSSYLMAIAKYASLFFGDIIDGSKVSNATSNKCPENFWAYLRRADGELRNAHHFITNYYHVNIDKIPIQLIALNYRFKYFQVDTNGFNSETIKKFNGVGKNYAEDWLNDRLHILDAYFNLQQENRAVVKYNYDALANTDLNAITTLSSVTEIVKYNTRQLYYYNNRSTNVPTNYNIDTRNPDIYIINHIFNSDTSAHIKGTMSPFEISAFDMSPLVIKGTNNAVEGSFIVPKATETYTIDLRKESNENWLFGGSQAWTKLNNISPFIDDKNAFYIDSDKIREIYGTSGSCGSWGIYCQSLEKLSLTQAKNFTGTLTITGDLSDENSKYWQNLKTLDISGTSIQLDIDNSVVNTINCSGVTLNEDQNTKIIISNCLLLNALTLTGLTVNTFQLTPVNTKNFKIDNVFIKQITLSPKEADSNFTVSNIKKLQTLKINSSEDGSIESLIIENCTNLENLQINNQYGNTNTGIKTLKIIDCNLTKLQNTSNDLIYIEKKLVNSWQDLDGNYKYQYEYILHLEKLKNLQAISFENTLGFTKVILSNNEIRLLYKAFSQTDLTYIDFDNATEGTLILCDNSIDNNAGTDCKIFFNSSFSLQSNETNSTKLNFKVLPKPTVLNNIFAINKFYSAVDNHNGNPQITYEYAVKFINELGNKEWVTSLYRAFLRQENLQAYINPNITSDTQKPEDVVYVTSNYIINGGASAEPYRYLDDAGKPILMSFSGYNRLSNISECFEYCKINFIHKSLFSGINFTPTVQDPGIHIENAFDDTRLIFIHKDAFKPISGLYYKFLFTDKKDDGNGPLRFCSGLTIYDDDKTLTTVNLRDFIFGNSTSNMLNTLSGFNIIQQQKLNFTDLFTENDTLLTSINNVFTNLDQTYNSNNICDESNSINTLNKVGLKNLSNLTIFQNAFICSSEMKLDDVKTSPALIDICNMFDWKTQGSILLGDENKYSFNFYKFVNLDSEDWNSFWNSINQSSSIITQLNNVFSNTVFKTSSNDKYLNIPSIVANNTIMYANSLFENSTMLINNEECGIKLNNDSLKGLKGSIKSINSIFKKCILNGDTYPIPANLFDNLTSLIEITDAFAYTTIIATNGQSIKTYKNESYKKETIFETSDLELTYQSNSITFNSNVVPRLYYCYPILPPNLLSSLKDLQTVDGFISHSDFEGYIPAELFERNTKLKSLASIFEECKVLPQHIKTYSTNEEIASLDIYNKNTDGNPIKIFVFIPNNFIPYDSNNDVGNYPIIPDGYTNLFSFYLTLSKSPLNRVYLFTNKSLPLTKIGFTINGFSPLYHPKSKIIQQWAEDGISIVPSHDQYITEVDKSVINVYFNIDDNYEGLTIDILSLLKNSSCIADEKLTGLIYGYLFKKGTYFNRKDFGMINSSKKIYIAKGVMTVYPKGSNGDPITYPFNQKLYNIILPSILTQYPIRKSYFPATGKLWNTIDNSLMIDNICNFYQGLSINVNNIDTSFIDNIEKTNLIPVNDEDTHLLGLVYNDGVNDIIYISKEKQIGETYSDDELNEAIEQCKNELKQLVYYNYLVLYNIWKKENIQWSSETDETGQPDQRYAVSSLDPYFNVKLYDEYNRIILVRETKSSVAQSSVDEYLRLQYNVKLYRSNTDESNWIVQSY